MKKIIVLVVVLLLVGVVGVIVFDAVRSRNKPSPTTIHEPKTAIPSPPAVDEAKLAQLVLQLGELERRAAASDEIKKIGKSAIPYLSRTMAAVNPETRAQIQAIIDTMEGRPPVSLDEKLASLILQLADPEAGRRAAASDEIKKIGKPALPYLQKATVAVNDQVRAQLQPLIEALTGKTPAIAPSVAKAPEEPVAPPKPEPVLPEPKSYRLATSESTVAAGIPNEQDINPVISPDGKRVAFSIQRGGNLQGDGGNFMVVVDNRMGMMQNGVGKPVFSPDSKRVAYSAAIGTRQFIVANDWQSKLYSSVEEPRFSPDSKRIAFAAERDGKYFMVVDEDEGKRYDAIRSAPSFSPDGKRLGYVAKHEGKLFAVVDGKEGDEFERIEEIFFSPDNQRFAYVGERKNRKAVVINGVEGKEYSDVGNPVFSPDGKRVVYWAAQGAKRFLVVDGVEGKEYDDIACAPYFSVDGKHEAFTAARGNKRLIVSDGNEGEVNFERVAKNTPLFSPDGKRLAFAGIRGEKFFAVVDGVESKPYDGMGSLPVFSPDSRHVAFLARRDKKWLVVVDGMETKEFVAFPQGAKVVFDTARTLHVMTLSGADFRLLNIELVPQN